MGTDSFVASLGGLWVPFALRSRIQAGGRGETRHPSPLLPYPRPNQQQPHHTGCARTPSAPTHRCLSPPVPMLPSRFSPRQNPFARSRACTLFSTYPPGLAPLSHRLCFLATSDRPSVTKRTHHSPQKHPVVATTTAATITADAARTNAQPPGLPARNLNPSNPSKRPWVMVMAGDSCCCCRPWFFR